MAPLSEHTARLCIQGEASDAGLRRIVDKFGPGIDATEGTLASTGKPTVVMIHFLVPLFTAEGARQWLRANGYRPIEFIVAPAGGKVASRVGAAGTVVLTATVDIREAVQPDSPTTFTLTAYAGGPMRVPGCGDPIALELAGLGLPGFVPVLATETQERAGRGQPRIVNSRLEVCGTVSRATGGGRIVMDWVRSGLEIRAAISLAVEQAEAVPADGEVVINGRELTGPLTVIRRASLRGISFTSDSTVEGEAVVEPALSVQRDRAASGPAEAAEVLTAWPSLPLSVREKILGLSRSAGLA
jgi:hypothetical protein